MNLRKLYQYVKKTSKSWKGVSRHFKANVVVFSRGVVRAQSSQIRKIAGCVEGKHESQRRRLQRFVAQPICMAHFFTQWTYGLMRDLGCKEVVLAVDETKLKDRFGVMVVGLVYEGRCIPLAWRVYRANRRQAYPSEGQTLMILSLLEAIRAGLPSRVRVRVLADRGIGTSPELMRGVDAMGWTFLFRVTKQSKIVLPDGQAVTFYDQVQAPGQYYQASGLVFKKRGRVPGHVRVVWGYQAKEAWALATNDPALSGWEYAQRMWIEEAFRDLKSHGWQLEQALLDCPERMERLWILLVVAYAWLLIWGKQLELAGLTAGPKRLTDGTWVRRYSLFREGRQAFLTYSTPLRP